MIRFDLRIGAAIARISYSRLMLTRIEPRQNELESICQEYILLGLGSRLIDPVNFLYAPVSDFLLS
jgi:hypothetical protein